MKHNRSNQQKSSQNSKVEAGKKKTAVDENLKKFDASESDADATETSDETSVDADDDSSTDARSQDSRSASSGDESSLDKFTNQLLKLAPGIADSSITQAKETIEHAMATFETAKNTYAQARETIAQAKSTIDEVKSSAKGAIGKIRANPQPFFAAIAPGAIGAFLLVEKWRKSQMN